MVRYKGFPCSLCKKWLEEQFAYTREYNNNKKYGNRPCPNCGKISKKIVELVDCYDDNFKRKYIGCSECIPVMGDIDYIWYTDRVCSKCLFSGLEEKDQQKDAKIDKLINNSLIKENQELRQQLSEVQKQLAEVLEELKNNSVGQNNEKLTQQIVQNEKLIKDGENASSTEVQEQVKKSQVLVQKVRVESAIAALPVKNSEERKRNNSHLTPYLLGGLMVIISSLIFMIGLLLGKRSKKEKNN